MIRPTMILIVASMSGAAFAQTAPHEPFPENAATDKAPDATLEKGVVSGTLVEMCAQWNLSKTEAASCRKELSAAKTDKERLAVRTRYETRNGGKR